PASAAFDVEELLRTQVRAEPGLRYNDVREREGGSCCKNAIAPMRDVTERSSVNKCRSALERLYEIRANCVLEKQRHGSGSPQLAGSHGTFGRTGGGTDDDAREALLEVLRTRRQRDDRHDLARGNDDEMLFARNAVARSTQSNNAIA